MLAIYAVALFALAAGAGIALVSAHIDGRIPSMRKAILHGLFAVGGVALILVATLKGVAAIPSA